MNKYPTYLIHYGIPGQKWGVRRWQNDDGSLTSDGYEHYGYGKGKRKGPPEKESYVLKKGTIVNRISIHKNEKLKGSKYAYTDIDKDVYEGAFAKYQKYAHGDKQKIYKKTLEVKEDLIAPSDKKAHEIINNRLSKDKKLARDVNSFSAQLMNMNHGIAKNALEKNGIKVDSSVMNTILDFDNNGVFKGFKISSEQLNKVYKDMEFGSYNLMIENNKKELNKLLKEVSKQGYNAIMDYNNVKVYNDAAEPFIAINAKKTLKEIDNKRLEDKQIEESFKRLENKLNKKGKSVVL